MDHEAGGPQRATAPSHEPVIAAYYAGFNDRRLADVTSLFARDAVGQYLPGKSPRPARPAYDEFARVWLQAFPDARMHVEQVRQWGPNTCETVVILEGCHERPLDLGSFGWFEPSHSRVRLRLHEAFEIAAGTIHRASVCFDLPQLTQELSHIDFDRLGRHLERIEQLRSELERARPKVDARRQVVERLGVELDAARLLVRPWFRKPR